MRKERGFTLIELVLVIGIIALLIMSVGLTSGIRETAKLHSAAESVKTIRAAAEGRLAAGNMTYTGVSVDVLKTAGLLPANFTAAGSNPWGGDYTVAANTDPNKVDISLTAVSEAASTRLSALFSNSAAATSYASETWTATF